MYINKAKLLEWLKNEGWKRPFMTSQINAMRTEEYETIIKEIESGTFDTDDRYRTALKQIRDSHEPWVFNLVNDALEGGK